MQVLLVDDHELFRDGMKFLLRDLDENLVFSEAGSCAEAVDASQSTEFDVVLLDMNLPDTCNLDCLRAVREQSQYASIVVLSSDDDSGLIRAAISEGAAGYIPKSSSQQVLIAALRLVLAGGTYIPPNMLDPTLSAKATAPADNASQRPLDHLTERQRQVLMAAVQGKVNKIIARELDISEATVKAHLSASFRALGVNNRTEAVFAVASVGAQASG